MVDRGTLDYYSAEAKTYADFVGDAKRSPQLKAFAGAVTPGGQILDFGCGHGWASAVLAEAGFDVTPLDAAEGFAAQAQARYGLTLRLARFDEMNDVAAFDGIWASFSLLHDTRAAFPGHLTRLRRAARPGAPLYLGLKEGVGEKRDALGRFYTFFGVDEVTGHLQDAGWGDIAVEGEVAAGLAGTADPVLHITARAV